MSVFNSPPPSPLSLPEVREQVRCSTCGSQAQIAMSSGLG